MGILCVDDDPGFLDTMVEMLQGEGYAVDRATSYSGAIEAFTSNRFQYDVVITDIDFKGHEDGEQLAAALIELRERRGYDAAPEIICLTGAESKIDPKLKNRLQERGCQYVLKGTNQYFVETQAAIMRLQDLRAKGPTLLFRHEPSQRYRWEDKNTWNCGVGEDVSGVFVLYSGERKKITMGPAPRRVLDFLARRAWRRPFSVEEVANSMALTPFYDYWNKREQTISSQSVKSNVWRIRRDLDKTFRASGLPLTSKDVLTTETCEDQTEPTADVYSTITSGDKIKTVDIESLQPYSGGERYKFIARAFVEHVP